ncbi:MAG: patatin-like phospholipase family protein [Clostridia bacterium]|nr:patatin-like phospholipase family protein [Clostridia bacterium]
MKIINFLKKKPKIGLAFGGGGARGLSHIGVIKAFEEFGLKFDYVAGTSVGSIMGAAYASGMTSKEIYEIAKKLKVKDIRTSKLFFMPSKTEGIENLMIETFGDINIEDLKLPFSAVAVDIKSTKELCISHGNLSKAVAGSCCVPGIFQPVEFGDRLLCDGGLQNTIPANIPRYFGCDYVIAVDCNSTRLYGTESTKVLDVLGCTIRILMKSNAVKGYMCADATIATDNKKFKSTSFEGMDEMIEQGYKNAIDMMPQIMQIFRGKIPKKKMKDFDKDEIEFI